MGSTRSRYVRAGTRRRQRLAPIRWGLLVAVASAHAAGLLALYGLGEPRPSASPLPPPAISVRLVAPEPATALTLDAAVPAPATPPPGAAPRRQVSARPAPRPPRVTVRPVPTASPASPSPPAPPANDAAALVAEEPSDEPVPVAPAPVAPTPAPSATGAPAERASGAAPAALAAKEADRSHVSASFDAAYLDNAPPAYPAASRRRGEEGRVVLRVEVRADGRPGAVEVAESSGHERLDAAARDTVRGWRFVPARRGDAALDSWLRVPVVFRLDR